MKLAKMPLLISSLFLFSGLCNAYAAQVPELEKLNICYSSIAATSVTTWVPQAK
jgi:hypothetical protein